MDNNSVSPMTEKAPMAEFDKSPPTPPDEESAPVDLPPPPPVAVNVDPLAPPNEKSRMDGEGWGCGNWLEYVVMVFTAIVLLLASTVIVVFWAVYYRNGFAWNSPDKLNQQFNLHPVLMIAGFVTLSGFSMLLYRLARSSSRIYVKLTHTIFHAMAIPCVVVGFLAVFDWHNRHNMPNFHSLHSWLGFVTMGLFALQFVVGFFSFLILLCCESSTAGCRASLVPFHAAFGFLTFMLAVATCLTGLTQEMAKREPYFTGFTSERVVCNALAMTLAGALVVLTYVLSREDFRYRGHIRVSVQSEM